MTLKIPNLAAAKKTTKTILDIIKPPPELTVSEWADTNRRLSAEASSEAGVWSTSRAEYQRGIMDAISDDAIETVVIMSCAQVGKTEMLLNLIGFHIEQNPCPMLVIQPTLDMAQTFSKDRLAPMLRDTPVLKGKVKDARARDSNNTTLKKNFDGGHITMCGANSPSSLASRPIRLVLFDEVDRFPPSAGSEGDPILLAKARAKTFHDKKFVMVSTPTIEGSSRISSAFEETDKREYYVPCHECGEDHVMKWKNVHWEQDKPETACYTCEHCGAIWDDAARYRAIRRGHWRATAPDVVGKAGFRLSGLYSPWTSLENAVRDFLEAKKLPETLRVFVNTFLGETWTDEGERVDDFDIASHREDYGEKVPEGVVVLTAGCDVQSDRLEVEVVGFGVDEESWSVDYRTLYGDPNSAGVWAELDAYLSLTWEREDGVELTIKGSCVDSGGHHTQSVYRFCKPRLGKRIFAIKGIGGEGKPLLNGRPSTNNNLKCKLWSIGVDTAKEIVYSRLKIKEQGAGYCHFPQHYTDEYFKQLTAEKVVKKYHKGFHRREWIKVRPRNEALDCRVYALAALNILGISVNMLAQKSGKSGVKDVDIEKARPKRRQTPRKSGNFVQGWR
jgi:phage terminase large subunit GpA-like protein